MPTLPNLAAYSSSLGHQANVRLMECWSQHVQELGLRRSGSLDLDFHTVAADTAGDPLERHCVSRQTLAGSYAQPAAAWQRITLSARSRIYPAEVSVPSRQTLAVTDRPGKRADADEPPRHRGRVRC